MIVPAVTTFCMDTSVTAFTKCNEIAAVMGAALGERKAMVDFLGRNQHTLFVALLTEWMLLDIAVTDALPRTTIPTAYSRVSVVLLVALVLLAFMLRAKPTICQVGAAGMGTGTLWFSWQLASPPFGHKESPAGLVTHKALCDFRFSLL